MGFTLRFLALVFAFAAAAIAISGGPQPRPATAAGDCYADEVLDAEESAFLTLINQHRAQNGRLPLGISYTLSRAAAWKSRNMGELRYFAHDDLDRTWVQRIRDCGYGYNTWLGENIAAGIATAQQAFDLWKNSPGHNANMLNANYKAIGIGRVYVAGSPYGWYWTTEFGGVDDGWSTIDETPTPVPTPADTSPPTVWTIVSVSDDSIFFRAWVFDVSAIARVDFYVDGRRLASDSAAPYNFTLRRDGALHDVRAVAYDIHGNAGSMRRFVR